MTTTTDLIQHTDQIRNLNDQFRKGALPSSSLGRLVQTKGVLDLVNRLQATLPNGSFAFAQLIEKVQAFDQFDEANDPHGEHDFFSFDFHGKTLFVKIDYYDLNYEYGSENPADPSKTRRVLTIMLSEEY